MSAPSWPGRPGARRLVYDGVRTALVQRVSSIAGALVVGIVCVVVLATAGQSSAAEQAVLGQVDAVGTRLITVVDQQGRAGLDAAGVLALPRTDAVAEAFGLGPATDVRGTSTPEGASVALRSLIGDVPTGLTLVSGRMPRAGEAVAGDAAARTLGLIDGVGAIAVPRTGALDTPIVGVVHGEGPLASLNDLVLAVPHAGDASPAVRYVYITAATVGDVEQLTALLPDLLPSQVPSALTIEPPSGAIALREALSGQLGAASRRMMALVLAIGLVIVMVSTTAAVASRRRDFGRRRALGASRTAIVILVLVQTAVGAAVGCVMGIGAGLWATYSAAGGLPAPTFTIGVAALAMLVALLGAVPPALTAARRDPVRILRVP